MGDLLGFLALVALSLALVALPVAGGVCLLRRRWRAALRFVALLAGVLVAYGAALVLASSLSSDRPLALGERRCFDDWCVAASGVRRVAGSAEHRDDALLVVTLAVSSRAARISQRPDAPRFWVVDAAGRRYDVSPPDQLAWAMAHGPSRPVDDQIGPGESFTTPLVFVLPATAPVPHLVVAEGPPWLGLLLIGGEDSPFHGRTVVPLPGP